MNLDLKTGDILFSNLDCDEGTAIQECTKTPFTHIGLVLLSLRGLHRNPWQSYPCVLEAHGTVKLTPLDQWLNQCQNRIAWGRVLPEYEPLAQKASEVALEFLGRPYNHYYENTIEKLYCSSLLYYAFKIANNDEDFFKMKPMNFKDAWEEWKKHFGDRTIPQGEPGLNPGTIYTCEKIKILYDYRKQL